MSHRVSFAILPVLPILLACGSSGPPDEAPRPSSSAITRAELKATGAQNAYEAVQRLRPRWLIVRGIRSFSIETEVVVFQDRLLLGNQDALQRIGIEGIYEIEYVDGPTAQATLPGLRDKHIQGAIVIHMSPTREGGSGGGSGAAEVYRATRSPQAILALSVALTRTST